MWELKILSFFYWNFMKCSNILNVFYCVIFFFLKIKLYSFLTRLFIYLTKTEQYKIRSQKHVFGTHKIMLLKNILFCTMKIPIGDHLNGFLFVNKLFNISFWLLKYFFGNCRAEAYSFFTVKFHHKIWLIFLIKYFKSKLKN